MEFEPQAIPDVMLMTPKVLGDDRGFFMETFRQNEFERHCGVYSFVQENHSQSAQNILRGLHYQLQNPQGKLVRVTRGKVYDVAVDLRKSSSTFGRWVGVYLSEENKRLLWVPPGFAHGFYVTSTQADLQYKCTNYYTFGDECFLSWSDPALAIDWPLSENHPILSSKDRNADSMDTAPKYD